MMKQEEAAQADFIVPPERAATLPHLDSWHLRISLQITARYCAIVVGPPLSFLHSSGQ